MQAKDIQISRQYMVKAGHSYGTVPITVLEKLAVTTNNGTINKVRGPIVGKTGADGQPIMVTVEVRDVIDTVEGMAEAKAAKERAEAEAKAKAEAATARQDAVGRRVSELTGVQYLPMASYHVPRDKRSQPAIFRHGYGLELNEEAVEWIAQKLGVQQ
jgi:hypothetical protein